MKKATIRMSSFFPTTRQLLLLVCLPVILSSSALAQNQTIGAGLEGQALINYLKQNYTPAQTLGYNNARDVMYSIIDNNNGAVTGVYTGYTITLNPNNDPSTDAYNKGINAEHTWPQSYGADSEPGRSDIHHLFPTKSNVNSARNNDPLAEIDDNITDTWYYQGQSQSTIPTSNISLYAENYGSTAFEPREQHKGNAARAIFYFVAIYQGVADQNFFDQQKDDLYLWHYMDEVDAGELSRSNTIASYQGNENPFILDTSLVRRAFFPDGNTGDPDTTPPIVSSVQPTSIGANSATIIWTTDELATSTVEYGTTTFYGATETNSSYTTSHVVTLTGLVANSTYNYQVSSTDGSSNTANSGNFTFTTNEEGSSAGSVVISEVFYDTPGTDSDEEWVEIYNGTSSTVDLGGYTIVDNNGTGSSYTFPSGSTIVPGSYFTFATTATGFQALYSFDADLYGSLPALNNTGDVLILKDAGGAEVDVVAWEGGASSGLPAGWGSSSDPVAATGESIYRSSVTSDSDTYSDWATAGNNGDPQTQASAPVMDYILFSEVFYDTPGTDSEEEWIELYNPTASAIDISGWTVTDNNGVGASYSFPSGSIVEATSYFTVANDPAGFNALYGADAHEYGGIPSLNNTGDALLLTDASANLMDEVAWEGGASEGVPSGWGTGPTAATGESMFRNDVNEDNDSDADWVTASNNGDPATITTLDTAAPLISSVSASEITPAEAIITWTTDENANSQVNYGESTSYGTSVGGGDYITSHSVSLTGLTAGTEYFYQIISVDEAGNIAVDGNYSFTTTSPPASNLPDILISEVFYDTPGNESDEEWVELYNTTSQTISLVDWKLVDDNGDGQSFTFSNNHTIAGNTFLTLALDRKAFKSLYNKNADDFVSLPPLNNGGDVLILQDASGAAVDVVAWEGGSNSLPSGWGSSSLPSAGEGFSFYRSDIGVDSDTYTDWTTSTDLGSPMTQSDGTFPPKVSTSKEEPEEILPSKIILGNYPNPFNPNTQVVYSLPEPQRVTINVYNMLGQQVATLVDGYAKAGNHTVIFDASGLSSGVYIYTIQTASKVITEKMLLMK